MPGAEITIITQGGGGNRITVDYDTPYNVAAGDTAENEGPGAKELHFYNKDADLTVIPLAGNSGYEFAEAGVMVALQ